MAHLDEDPRKKAMYDPDQIEIYGNLKIDRFLADEDKSMTSLIAWQQIKRLILDNHVRDCATLDDLMDLQDIELQLQYQKNTRLATRTKDYIYGLKDRESQRTKTYIDIA